MTGGTGFCWVCGDPGPVLVRPSTIPPEFDAGTFRITNSDYGVTGAIFRCRSCGFMQCSQMDDVLRHYETLEDPAYEASRPSRVMQEGKLIEALKACGAQGRLLDVGAASGALVEAAGRLGFRAEGVEPSRWLAAKARERGLAVHEGTLPHPAVHGPYDAVTMVDIIEHVPQPFKILETVKGLLAPGGLVAVVTPDVRSAAARLMGRRWWHFRTAHVGYFDRKTLDLLFRRAGFKRVRSVRPTWYFTMDYLAERLQRYILKGIKFPVFFKKIIVPLNLGDSILAIYRKSA